MREHKAKLAGSPVKLAVTWAASREVADAVGDPMMIAREAAKEALFSGKGMSYAPSFVFTVENVPQIIHIGMEAAGDDRSLEDVAEMVMAHGLFEAQSIAGDYIAALVSPQSKELKASKGASDEGKS